jgi:hypothetical protein
MVSSILYCPDHSQQYNLLLHKMPDMYYTEQMRRSLLQTSTYLLHTASNLLMWRALIQVSKHQPSIFGTVLMQECQFLMNRYQQDIVCTP